MKKSIIKPQKTTKSNRVTKYHANGKTKWSVGKIVHGQPEGYWQWFRLDGTLKRSGHFTQGQPTGTWITYNQLGKPYKTTIKKDGQHGKK